MPDKFLQLVAIAPHPPIIIPEIGKEERHAAAKTIDGITRLAAEVKRCQPETVVVITPHAAIFSNAVTVSGLDQLSGDLGQFGAYGLKFSYQNDVELAQEIFRAAAPLKVTAAVLSKADYPRYDISQRLDHGVLVPLYFLRQQGVEHRLVWVSIGMLSSEQLYAFGVAIQRAVNRVKRRTVVLVSGDLSHRLTEDAPAGYDPRGSEFDHLVERSLAGARFLDLLDVDEELADAAGQCGLKPIQIGLGTLDGWEVESKVLSYEGPYGVGYLNALLVPKAEGQPSLFETMRQRDAERMARLRQSESPEVRLARTTLERYLKTGEVLRLDDVPPEWRRQAGVFVSIKKQGQLRGCIGTIEPTKDNLAAEIIHNAISAGTHDPRFAPVQEYELDQLVYSVDVLAAPEPISGPEALDPQRYGVIVRSGRKSGLLLPNLEGIDTVEEQVRIAKQKAGIRPDEKVTLSRFEVVRYH